MPCCRLNALSRKPSLDRAQEMLDQGGYLWNSGIFLYAGKTLIAAFERHAPAMLEQVRAAVSQAQADLGFLRLGARTLGDMRGHIGGRGDHGKVRRAFGGPACGDWSDLGGWEAVLQHSEADAEQVACQGPVRAIDCKGSLLRSENDGQQLLGLGLENIVAVAMPDAVLVADRSRVSELGDAVKAMRKAKVPQADTFPIDHRPWGFFETLTLSDRFQVKRIVVNPGAALSLQSHMHRAEHWIVVAGHREGDD